LTFDLLTPKSIGVCYSIRAIMKFEGSGSKGTRVIERKRSVTDGQTDRQPDGQVKNNMSPPEGGDITTTAAATTITAAAPSPPPTTTATTTTY